MIDENYVIYNNRQKVDVHCDSIIKYGISDNYIDVTNVALEKCVYNNRIIIPQNDHKRAALFGDPVPFVVKNIYVKSRNNDDQDNEDYQDYNNKNIKIIIYTPAFNINCGGVVALYNLTKIINSYSYNNIYAKIITMNNTKPNNNLCNEYASRNEVDENTIVIYPEIINGNPLQCKNVIRWILLEVDNRLPESIYKNKNWNNNDLIYFWETKNKNNPFYKQLTCHYLNPIFRNTNANARNKSCYLIKKGTLFHNNIDYFHKFDSICIDNLNLETISKLFNESEYFYSYDPNTMFIIYAILCGCIPIIYPIMNINKERYFEERIYNRNNIVRNKGIAYGNSNEEIEYARSTLNEAAKELIELFASDKETVFQFLSHIDIYMKNKNKKGLNQEILNTLKNFFYL